MNAQSLNVNHSEFSETPASTSPIRLLPGFMHHLQLAQRAEREAGRLYAASDAEPGAMGISRDGIPAQLAGHYEAQE